MKEPINISIDNHLKDVEINEKTENLKALNNDLDKFIDNYEQFTIDHNEILCLFKLEEKAEEIINNMADLKTALHNAVFTNPKEN